MSEVSDALALVDSFTDQQDKRLNRALKSTQSRSKSSSYGQLSSSIKEEVDPTVNSTLAESPLSNVDQDDLASSVGDISSQLIGAATNLVGQLPNRLTGSSFGSLSTTDGISGSDSSLSSIANGGVLSRANPLVGGASLGLSSLNIGGTSGITDFAKQQALSKLEKVVNNKVGFNIRQVVTDVQNAVITMTTVMTTAKTDIALELVANNARLILAELDKKDAIADKIMKELMALHNLVAIVMGGLPEFEKYLSDLIRAYNLILAADTDLKTVVHTLSVSHKYNGRLYSRAYDNLVAAQKLILPSEKGPPARINEFIDAILHRSTSKEAFNAYMAIPGVIQTIAKLMLNYSTEILIINGLIALYLTALNNFISSFKRSDAVDQATIDHLNAAIKQLDALLEDMKVLLFPADGKDKLGTYPAEVTSAAAGWSVRLATTIQWLAKTPGIGSQVLDLTKSNVAAYTDSVEALKALNDRKYGLSILKVSAAQENVADTAKQIGRLMITAATCAYPKKSKLQISSEFKQAYDLMQNTKNLSGDIRRALLPFAEAQSAFSRDVSAVTSSLIKVFDDMGMKRGADLLKKADFGNLFKLTPATSTYAGAAAGGLGLLLKNISTSASISDQDYGKVAEMKNNFDRVADVDMTESVRSFASQESLFSLQVQEMLKSQKSLSSSIKAIALRADPESVASDPLAITAQYASKAVGGKFNFGAV